jgi:penicillin-binding protein 1A
MMLKCLQTTNKGESVASRAVKGRYHVKKKNGKAIVLSILAIFIAVCAACVIGVSMLVNSWLEDLPDYSSADAFNTSATSVVYASDGQTVLAEFQLENRDPVEMDEISPYVLEGTVATEDERFYSHGGVDLYGTARALVNNLVGGALEGGSTITQQLVRNTILSEEMTDISLKRKVREVYLATKLEEMYSKDEILLMYLNTINYGSGAYGIEAASERYFSKHASELTLAEAAALIGIPQSPTYNNPIDNMSKCQSRRDLVLDRMVSNSVITEEEAQAAKAESIVLNVSEQSNTGILAYPYFTSYVRNQLLSESGKYAFSTADLFSGGLKIVTTLDVEYQQYAEEAAERKEKEAGSQFEVALCAIDPDNGYIRAMVGGKDYSQDQVNMATGEGSSGRQAGSSFKTFTLLAALEAGISPDTYINAGSSFDVPGSTTVHNNNNASYGTIPISTAFALSSNTAFMRLIMSVGVDNVIDVAQRCGITSELQSVAGLTLGISSVTPLEMADAYATIANGGTHYDAECIISITDSKGNVIVDNSNPTGKRVLSEEVACAALEVMQGVVTSGTGKAAQLENDQPVAGKTGTTDDKKDSWFVGCTPQMSVAIWLGERASSYADADAVTTTAASTFAYFMDKVLDGKAIEKFPTADDPDYDLDYEDEEYDIGGTYRRYSSYYDDDDDEDTRYSSRRDDDDDDDTTSGGSSKPTSGTTTSGGTNTRPTETEGTSGGGNTASTDIADEDIVPE